MDTISLLDAEKEEPFGAGLTVESTPPSGPTAGETVLTQQVRYYTAICSFAAGILHLLAMVAHADHHPAVGRAFLAVAVLQIAWAVLLVVEPRRIIVILGGLLMAGSIGVWVFSRTKGISWFPGLEALEPLEWRDIVTQFFQLVALAGAALLLVPGSWFRPASGKKLLLGPIAVFAVLAMGTTGVVYAATHDYQHHDGGAETGEHGH
ncbi:MAG: hypothetical protein SGJ13_10440 [Actinomycetota bacterium]|nr:hypothetical protein [Actinomycetota bacterium]